MAWVIVEDAALDMQHIAEEAILNFGDDDARRYTLKLSDMFDRLAAMPHLASLKQSADRNVGPVPCGAQRSLYVAENEDVVILRV